VAAAASLPAEAGAPFLTAGRTAFLSGFTTAAIIAAGLLLLAAVTAFVMFCGVPKLGSAAAPNEIDGDESRPAPAA